MARSTTLNVGVIGAAQLTVAVANQLVIIVLAHFLRPSDFGIFAVCQVIINLALAVSSFGLEEAAVQTKKNPEMAVVTAASLRLVLALVAMAVMFVSAPYVTRYFAIENATLALQLLGISFVLLGLAFVPRVWLKRELKFGLIALSSIVNVALWSVMALVLGVFGAGFWALIIAFLIGTLGTSVTLWVLRPSKLQFRLDRTEAKDLTRFGAYIMATNLLVFFFMSLDKVAIGKMLGSDVLGVYWIAFQYGTQPTFFITAVMIAVIFPTYVNLAGDINVLRAKHRRVLRYLTLASFPIGVGLASVSPSFIICLFGSQWSGAVAPLSLLCIFGIMYSITSTSGSVYMSTNNARQMFKQNIVMIIPFIALLIPAVKYLGLDGVALLFVGVIFVQLVWVTLSVSRILSYPPLEDLRLVYAIPVAASIAMAAVVVSIWLIMGTSIVTLIVQIFVGFAVYGAVVIAATRGEIIQEMRSMLGIVLHQGKT